MSHLSRRSSALLAALLLALAQPAWSAPAAPAAAAPASAKAAAADRWQLPITVTRLPNGLTLVVSPDHSSPTVGISVVYKVGMRQETPGRTGFAHLFEHLMFQGTPKAPKGVFDRVTSAGGGDNNGSTRPDYTNYIERAPISALEPLLWLEADRMKTLDFNPTTLKNQQDVVKEEIRVNVQNQPYGGFMWLDISLLAFDKWASKHDGYGSFEDLEKANLDDVRAFHRDFYGPNNAVLAIAGDVTPAKALALVRKHFGAIPSRPVPKAADVSEGLNTAERRLVQPDALAQVPALAAAWKVPDRGSADHVPFVVATEILAGGNASRFYNGLVKGRQLVMNYESLFGLTSPWGYNGPTVYTVFAMHKPTVAADAVLAAIDEEVALLAKDGPDAATLSRVKTQLKAQWYGQLEPFLSRADTLAQLQALWGDAQVANRLTDWIDAVTAADVQRVLKTYLTRPNRSVIERRPAPAAPATSATAAASAAAPK